MNPRMKGFQNHVAIPTASDESTAAMPGSFAFCMSYYGLYYAGSEPNSNKDRIGHIRKLRDLWVAPYLL